MEKKRSYFNLDETLRQAVEHFELLDPGEIAAKAKVEFNKKDRHFVVPFIGKDYLVSYPDGKVTSETGEKAPTYFAIIILHYLISAEGTPLARRWIAYRHLPGGDIYNGPFQQRAINPLLKTFGNRPEDFARAARRLGGEKQDQSGISYAIFVLPQIPVCLTIWPGDEEMPASANILFDESAPGYLPTEDYAHLPGLIIAALKENI